MSTTNDPAKGLKGFKKGLEGAADLIPQVVTRSIADSLLVIANAAAVKFMIQTSNNPASKFARTNAPVHPTRLTWRTGALARSLLRKDDPDNINVITNQGTVYTGLIGTSKRYARIHEFGGTIPAHSVTITEKMRRFFLAKFLETRDFRWTGLLKKTKTQVNFPARVQKARPFMAPALTDPDTIQSVRILWEKRFPTEMVDIIRKNITVGAQ